MAEKEKTQLSDAADLQVDDYRDFEEREQKLVALWTKRFDQSENFRRPYIDKNLRMYKLYRAYRDAFNYAYQTNLMPPTGFEIVETVKPRLASAQIKVNFFPKKKEHMNSPNIDKWDDLVEYTFQEMGFDDKKIQWINAQLMFGNGTVQMFWNDKFADIEVVDNWLFYPDPRSQNRLKNSRWEIKQSFKSKAVIEKEEKSRKENPLYTYKNSDGEEISLIKTKKWKDDINDEQPTGDDPRRERYQLNTLKMGQIDDARQKKSDIQTSRGSQGTDKDSQERTIEIWECWDHVEDKLQVIMNRTHLVRDEENPYQKVNEGKVFIDMPNIMLNWEYYAMSILEPVETTIKEIADSRNQAMDDIVFSLDPIRKVKKDKGYKSEDLRHSPGATWYLNNADDVVIERGPGIASSWIEKDNILRREIQTSLALSEYTQGIPQSGQEPNSKVETLLLQTNIRFSLIFRQMEIAYTELVNSIIEMNQEFLEEDLAMRILGKNFRFEEFKMEDKEVKVDAMVSIEPKREKTPEQESNELLEMYKMFVVEQRPEQSGPELEQWKKKKYVLERLLVRKLGYEEFEDVLVPEPQKEEELDIAPPTEERPRPPMPPTTGGMVGGDPTALPEPIPLMPIEEPVIPEGI